MSEKSQKKSQINLRDPFTADLFNQNHSEIPYNALKISFCFSCSNTIRMSCPNNRINIFIQLSGLSILRDR